MVDYRNEFIQAVKNRLTTMVDVEVVDKVVDAIVLEAVNYEMSKLSTELAVYDGTNEKMIKSFIACMIVEGRSKNTTNMYMYSLKKFFAYIGNKPYDQVNAFDVRAWLASLKLSGCKNVSVRNQKNNITAFFNWLYNDGIIEKNPCATIRPIKVEQEEKNCFLRVTELCNLKMSDVDFNSMTVHVKRGKGGKDRITFISPVAKKYVYLYLAQAKHKSEYVFTTNLDGKYTSDGIQRITRNLSKRCGFHVHPHRFRRTLASDLARKGMPIQEIQKLLGHTSIETTRRYTDTKIEKVHASYKQYIA